MRINGLQLLFVACMALSLGFFAWGVGLVIPMERSETRADTIKRIHHEVRFRYRNCHSYLLETETYTGFLTFSSCDEGGTELARLVKAAADQGRPLEFATNQHGRLLYVHLDGQEIDMFANLERDRRLMGALLIGATVILFLLFAKMLMKTRERGT